MSAEGVKEQPAVPIRLAEPSWPTVLATTLSIWLARRLRRPYMGQGGVRRADTRWRLVAFVLALAILTLVGLQLSGAVSTTTPAPSIGWPKAWIELLCAAIPVAGAFSMFVLAYLRRARGRHRVRRAALAGVSVRILTALAAVLAGRGGKVLFRESDAHLAGESGHDTPNGAKLKQAAGFVLAGARYRGQDWADAASRPVDAVLRSRFLSGLFVVVPTIVVAVEVLTHKGTMTVLTSFGSIFGVGTALAGAIKAGRKYRDVEPPEPKARQARKENGGA